MTAHVPHRPAIVLATGGGADADVALEAAADLALRSDVPLYVVLAWDLRHLPGELGPEFHAAHAAALLDRARERLVELGCTPAGARLVRGRPSQGILAVAKRVGASLIVTGTHHAGPLRRLFHDSVVEATVGRTAVPCLVVPPSSAAWPPERVLVGDDERDVSRRALIRAGRLASLLDVPMVVTRVRAEDSPAVHAPSQATDVELIDETGLQRISVEVVSGDPAVQLVHAAQGARTLIVLGRRWPGKVHHGAPERVTTRVLQHHDGATMIVPPALHTATAPREIAAAG